MCGNNLCWLMMPCVLAAAGNRAMLLTFTQEKEVIAYGEIIQSLTRPIDGRPDSSDDYCEKITWGILSEYNLCICRSQVPA